LQKFDKKNLKSYRTQSLILQEMLTMFLINQVLGKMRQFYIWSLPMEL